MRRCRESLNRHFQEGGSFIASDNNRDGKDLYEVNSSTEIEIKSGKFITDGNCGLKIVSWALGDETDFIKSNMINGMKERRNIFINGGTEDDIENHKNKQMDSLTDFLKHKVLGDPNPRLPIFLETLQKELQKAMRL